jgi:hypothetical protein
MEMPAPTEAAIPTRKVCHILCVANAAAKAAPESRPSRPSAQRGPVVCIAARVLQPAEELGNATGLIIVTTGFNGHAHEASGRRLWRLVLERSLTVDRRSSPSSPLSAIDSWICLSTFQVVVSGVLVFIIRIAIGNAYNYPTTP